MNRQEIVNRIRNNVFDMEKHTFEDKTIYDYIDEGIDRMKQIRPEFLDMLYLKTDTDSPTYLPVQYHHLLVLYGTSRCFSMDERYHQSTLFMNEFEIKLEELSNKIINGELTIVDKYGDEVVVDGENEYVVDNYFIKANGVI